MRLLSLGRTLLRKTKKLVDDPVLRRWIIGRALGVYPKPPEFTPHRPSYLNGMPMAETWNDFGEGCLERLLRARPEPPVGQLRIDLAGYDFVLRSDHIDELFDLRFDDIECLLAVHRFAWIKLAGPALDPGWVDAVWSAWERRFAKPDDSWAWHPYTAAERAINILDFAARHGLPGESVRTARLLTTHARAIAERLEYFGDHDTSNHLANNGRGLYRIGIELGLQHAAKLGAKILLEEAERLFGRSGMLREGSTHYHFLLCRNYVDAWLSARRDRRVEEASFRAIAFRTLSALAQLNLSGGIPLIGDISPDCPPDFLAGLATGSAEVGWVGQLDDDSRRALADLKRDIVPVELDELAADGWSRLEADGWSMLAHLPPGGWSPMPGHGHQDAGSFELHANGAPLFVDPGRGAYGEQGEAGFYVSAAAHNGLTIDGQDPYPPNKPYYDDRFRRSQCGPAPRVERSACSIYLAHLGFSRLRGLGEVVRRIEFDSTNFRILDRIKGRGSHRIVARLHTPWPAEFEGTAVMIRLPNAAYRLTADRSLQIRSTKRWTAYGRSEPASVIELTYHGLLPTEISMNVEQIPF